MARSISDIKKEMTTAFAGERAVVNAYNLDTRKTFDQQFSVLSIESVLFYVFAVAVWAVEVLFDKHAAEVDARIEQLEPHTLRWYVSKVKAFMYGYRLVENTDHYNTSRMSDTDIEKARVVKYAVATEDETVVYIKVAGQTDDGKPCLLNKSQFAALKSYVNTIKDAGVSVQLRNEEADLIRINLKVFYDPTLMNNQGELSDGSKPVDEAVQSVITNLPFNGIFRNTDLLEAIKAIPAVVVVDINSASGGVQAKARNANNYTTVVGYSRPYSGYYEIDGGTVNVIYQEYQTVEKAEK